ncbi:MAG: hypothetical protein ACOCV2_04695, partial [Persicimonas sp.]
MKLHNLMNRAAAHVGGYRVFASVLLMGGMGLAVGCASLYTYEESDEKPLEEICTGGVRVEAEMLIEDECG